MGNMPNLIDIDSYCNELSSITKINIKTIRYIVLSNFAKVYSSSEISVTDATENIESEIYRILSAPKIKIIASKNMDKDYKTENVETDIYQMLVKEDGKGLQPAI